MTRFKALLTTNLVLIVLFLSACSTPGLERNQVGLTHIETYQYEKAEIEFRKAVDASPQFHKFRNNLGVALEMQGRYEEAITQYRLALKYRPGIGLYHLNLGDAYRALNQLDLAADHYELAFRRNHHLTVAQTRLALTMLSADQFEEALEYLEQAGSANSSYPYLIERYFNAQRSIVSLHIYNGDYERAIQHGYETLSLLEEQKSQVIIFHEYGSLHQLIGMSHFRMGRIEEASAQFQKVREKYPGAYSVIFEGRIAMIKGNYVEAAYKFRHYLEQYRQNATASMLLATALQLQGETDEAQQQYEHAVSLGNLHIHPDVRTNYEYFEALALADVAWGRFENAISNYEKVNQFIPNAGWVYKELAELYRMQGRLNEAEAMEKEAANRGI